MNYSANKIICLLFILSFYGCSKINDPVENNNIMTWKNAFPDYSVSSLCVNDNKLYAGTVDKGLFFSFDNGASWVQLPSNFFSKYSEPTNHPLYIPHTITSIFADKEKLFVGIGFGTYGGVFLSTDAGLTWNERDAGLVYHFNAQNSFIPSVNCLTIAGGNFYAGTNEGVYRSTDYGMSWIATNADMSYQVTRLAVIGNNLFAGTSGEGVFISTNYGNNWTAVNTGLTNIDIYGLASIGKNLFAGAFQSPGNTTGGIFLSTTNGINWTNTLNKGLSNHQIDALISIGANLYAGTNNGIFRSTNNGADWTDISSGTRLDSSAVISIAVDGTNILVGTNSGIWHLPL